MDKNRTVIYTANFWDAAGYSLLARSFVKNLKERGRQVRIEAIPSPMEISLEEADYFKKLGRGPFANMPIVEPEVEAKNPSAKVPSPKNAIRILNFLPMTNVPKPPGPRGKRVIYTMMECEKVNSSFINRCNKYEECWTPTKFNKDVFEEAGLNIPCKILPCGIDPIYIPENAIEDIKFNYKVFGNSTSEQPEGKIFISIFRWSYRKGYDVLIKSYLRKFKKSDNVSLVIFSRHAAMSHDQKFKDAIENDINNLWNEFSNNDSPPIYWCNSIIPMNLMPSVYALGDVYVNCSRGEGISLPTLEASAMGLPVVCPTHTAFSDYVTNDNSYNFDVDEWVVCNQVPEWNRGWITMEFNGMRFPRLGDSKIDEIGNLMEKSINNTEESAIKNKNMRKTIADKYTWPKCTDLIEQYIDAE